MTNHGLVPPTSRPEIPGGPQTAAAVLAAGVRDHPHREALVGRHGRATYRDLDLLVNRAAHALLARGVRAGDRVATALPNDTDIVVAFLACMRLGVIWLGVSRALAPPEKAYLLRDAEVTLLLAEPPTIEEIATVRRDLPALATVVSVDPGSADGEWAAALAVSDDEPVAGDVDPFAPAAIAYTSGTTGFPKGAVHSQHNLLMPGVIARARGQYQDDDRLGVMLPLTLVNLMALGPLLAYQVGATCVAIDRVDAPGLAAWVRDERITTFATVPAIMYDLLTHPDVAASDLATLRAPGVGGADCPEAFRELYRERYGAEVTIGYGLTEAPTAVTMTNPDTPPVPGSAGRALPHVRIVVLGDDARELPPGQVGELCVGPALDGPWRNVYTPMLGYWNQPGATADALRDGLLHTGDLGCVDSDGEVFVKDRRHDLIIRGGANVYPAEVERVLHEDPRVAACAVVGRPDDRLGERVVAFVQVAPGAQLDADELRHHCQAALARYKVPEEIVFVEGFDRTPMGKIRKAQLRASFG